VTQKTDLKAGNGSKELICENYVAQIKQTWHTVAAVIKQTATRYTSQVIS
jgi:hypothetical protein